MGFGRMNNAQVILNALDQALTSRVELTLYGRAALQLGFDKPLSEFAISRDVDAILFMGQAEQLNEKTNFWEAVEKINKELAEQELYISHFFVEDQVIMTSDWKKNRCVIHGTWQHLDVYRLGNADLLLSKLMRDDAIDLKDALFLVDRAGFSPSEIKDILDSARIPDVPEIVEQFHMASKRLLQAMP